MIIIINNYIIKINNFENILFNIWVVHQRKSAQYVVHGPETFGNSCSSLMQESTIVY
jgi:hypothetical protein